MLGVTWGLNIQKDLNLPENRPGLKERCKDIIDSWKMSDDEFREFIEG